MQTIAWKNNRVRIIDQTRLPQRLAFLDLDNLNSLWWAIRGLKVRGAPAIGIAAALGVVLGMKNCPEVTYRQFRRRLTRVIGQLSRARPTAVNLFWALERIEQVVAANKTANSAALKRLILQQALEIIREDKQVCRRMAGFGASLIKDHDVILTHCNAGALACADYGTALGVIYRAKEQGKKIRVYADETRPLLQGARLTTWELLRRKIEVTLICDNMAAQLMRDKVITKILVGADRIAANGDAANKIGTYNLAVLADFHRIPFYVVAPASSFDLRLDSGRQIPIEQRDPREVRQILGRDIAPRRVKVYNPAFDVTPHQLISAIVTERGIVRKPYQQGLRRVLKDC